ncbi:flavin-containing amine oxidasedehydrogenase, putative [Trichophyton verrucosum HKI 0517]|uniref:Flavin-containing amine oxidasedehydrogenase, putative n=1 Tax=Trichophyton verrucosum (strain HKI 0517) TaxID=663202 RepID=D4DIZ9_TRIVH|nr:flavin-containing amine oxidasedehydrogenase, putative [Trichophyton verrucosum HKI 0517]EFE38159.1 flavin-containing amine oxidasedehydrogenase, putative [Trichophyton verrucosum HKI 0517]
MASKHSSKEDRRLKVLVIGAGAAGMSCAATLAKEPDKFEVTLLEKDNVPGGQAKSIAIDKAKFGADWVNIGAQGGPGIFRHTYNFFREYGHEPQETTLQFAFGKGKENFWTNVFPTSVVQEHAEEIRKFGELLTRVRQYSLLWHLPLKAFLRIFGFSKDFGNKIIYPATSIFFGMGNQGRDVPCGLYQGLFEDPDIKFCSYDMSTLVPFDHSVYAYPNMSRFYLDWAEGLRNKGVNIRFNTQVVKVFQRNKKGIIVETRRIDSDHRIGDSGIKNRTLSESYDKIVFCIPGDQAKDLLGDLATWREKMVLGTTQWCKDLTITHSDHAYFQRKFEVHYRDEIRGEAQTLEDKEHIKVAKGEQGAASRFQPSYFTFSYQARPEKMEVGYDCTRFQYQFRNPNGTDDPLPPFEDHIFQSHFIDEKMKHVWTVDLIDQEKIIEQKWWHQLSHRWQHFAKLVPAMKFLNGRNDTFYAGSWTYTNLHEVAVISGTAAAYRLGARYDKIDDVADKVFAYFLKMSHGIRFKRK